VFAAHSGRRAWGSCGAPEPPWHGSSHRFGNSLKPTRSRKLPASLCREPIKARHPQLLYESKLYKILQGGGQRCRELTTLRFFPGVWLQPPFISLLI
jgi:hypothetical protein